MIKSVSFPAGKEDALQYRQLPSDLPVLHEVYLISSFPSPRPVLQSPWRKVLHYNFVLPSQDQCWY